MRRLHEIWDHISSLVAKNWSVFSGRRSNLKTMGVLFMILDTLKHGVQWDWIGKMFDIKGPTFERLITRFIDTVFDRLYQLLVEKWSEELSVNIEARIPRRGISPFYIRPLR